MVKEPKYIVTAVNRLTGEREEVSLPMALDKASALLMKARRYARRQKGTGHHRYRVERFVPQEGVLPFAPPRKTGLSECKECKSVYPGVYFSTPGKHVIFANIKKRNNAI